MKQIPKYECSICGHKSNPESENQKRSISMHVNKQHGDEIPEDADASEFWTRIVGETDNRAKKEPLKPSGETEPKNVVYVVQAEFETSFEAESEAETFANQKPDVEDYMDTKGNYILIRCSTKEKADAMTRMLNKRIDPVSVEIFTEEAEPQSESSSFISSIGSKIRGGLPFKSSQQGGEERQVSPSVEKVSKENIIGHSVSADDYRHFQRTRADATDVEGLMMARQQIAKGERLGGRDWRTIAVAIVLILIGLGVFLTMIQGQGLGGMIPDIGGGGGGAHIP